MKRGEHTIGACVTRFELWNRGDCEPKRESVCEGYTRRPLHSPQVDRFLGLWWPAIR